MANGDTKTEAMLNVLGNGGTGDEFRGCCNTKTQSYILDAIDRINAIQPGGSSDFNDLENRPQLNGTAMTGNTNITNFTGTDGVNAGAQGLVPAPATTDNGSLLKADGTWGSEVWFKNQYNFPGVKITKDSRAAGQGSITIGAEAIAQGDYSVALGNSAYTGEYANSAVAVGQGADAQRTYSTAVGAGATSYGGECTAIGASSDSRGASTVAIGAYSRASSSGAISFAYCNDGGAQGVVNFGPFNSSYGYDNTNYRLLTGVHDAQGDHDAVTLGQLNALVTQLQNLGLNVSLQGAANNANQNSGSSEDPGAFEPDPGVIAPTVTCPFCGQQTSADSTICQFCGNDISGGTMPDPGEEPGPEIPPEEPTEEPVEG